MSESPSIPRRSRGAKETDFDGLRAAGIKLLERLSGETWTDYNLHDPGITILEHLCFGLTDLLYRVEFDVEDHLTGEDGAIDFAGQALHLPADILPCRPTTSEDYRRKILDCVQEVDDALICPWPWREDRAGDDGGARTRPGLHQIVLRPSETAEASTAEILQRVLELASKDRNLGEDVARVSLAQKDVYHLDADVDVTGSRPVEEILAEVYRVAEAYVAGRPKPVNPALALHEGRTIDQIFDGPVGCASRPLLEEEEYSPRIFVADIVSRVHAVEGVKSVRNLHLLRPGRGSADTRRIADVLRRFSMSGSEDDPTWTVPWLTIPDQPGKDERPDNGGQGARVRLWRRGQRLPWPGDFQAFYRRAGGGLRLDQKRHVETEVFYRPPAGEHRPLGSYQSVQQHFPAIYGVNAHGVPSSAPEDVWLAAFRLRSYLLLFEQTMGNFVVNLHHLRDLFSVGSQGGGGEAEAATYRFLRLAADEIPGFERFYGEVPPSGGGDGGEGTGFGPYLSDPSAHLARVIAQHDDVLDRRSRLQDHMLAVFGEALAPRTGSAGGNDGAMGDPPGWLVEKRARLLEQITEVTRDRGGGWDYLDSSQSPASGFKRRLALLLGVTVDAGFHVVEHIQLRPAGARLSDDAWSKFYGLQVSVLFPGWVGRTKNSEFRRRAEDVVALNCPAHVRAHCFWIAEAERMAEFERLQEDWRTKKSRWLRSQPSAWASGEAADAGPVDAAAAELVRFVWAMRRAHGS